MTAAAPLLSVRGLRKAHGRTVVLDGLDLDVEAGRCVVLLGASGSGKSTLMRHIAGLVGGDANGRSKVVVLGRTVQENGRIAADVRTQRARIGVIFQQFNLSAACRC